MEELQSKVALWQPPPVDGRHITTSAADRPVIPSLEEPAPRARARRAEPASIRLLPEHLDHPALASVLSARGPNTLVAEGDSWFDFPVLTRVDLLDALDELGWPTVSLAYRGDTVENMVYGTQGADGQPAGSDLQRLVGLVRQMRPAAVLFSAGGNDVAGNEFRAFLNHKLSLRPALREDFLKEYVHRYVRGAYETAARAVWAAAPSARFVMHGYAHAKPTGLGVGRIFGWNFVGPWLKPAFDATGYSFAEGAGIVRRVIDTFNAMLAELAASDARFLYVDLRPHVGTSLNDWSDELHLNNGAVRRAAKVMARALTGAVPQAQPAALKATPRKTTAKRKADRTRKPKG